MKKLTKEKLSRYGALAGAVAVAGSASAGVVYTDVNPDQTFTTSGNYNLDLNNDNIIDFNIQVSSYASSYVGTYSNFIWRNQQVRITPFGSNPNNDIMISYSGYSSFADALSNGQNISAAANWSPWQWGNNLARSNYSFSSWSGSAWGPYSNVAGPWLGQTDKYLGLRFDIAGNQHYGWARLDVGANPNTFTIKDYAYEGAFNVPIVAGDVGGPPVDSTTSLTLTDTSENYNSSDFFMTFVKAPDETNIAEYRIVLVPIVDAPGFTYSQALGAPSAGYMSVAPNGSNFADTLSHSLRDFRGQNIILNDQYVAFVVSVPTSGFSYNMSVGSNPMAISSPPPTPAAENVVLTDIGDAGNGADMKIDYDIPADESMVLEYKVLIVPKVSVGFLTLAGAGAVPDMWLTKVTPNGSNISVTLNATSRDFQGNLIVENKPYYAFILSVSNNQINDNNLSLASNELTLTTPASVEDEMTNVEVIQVSNGLSYQIEKFEGKMIDVVSITGTKLISKKLSEAQGYLEVNGAKGMHFVIVRDERDVVYTKKVVF